MMIIIMMNGDNDDDDEMDGDMNGDDKTDNKDNGEDEVDGDDYSNCQEQLHPNNKSATLPVIYKYILHAICGVHRWRRHTSISKKNESGVWRVKFSFTVKVTKRVHIDRVFRHVVRGLVLGAPI